MYVLSKDSSLGGVTGNWIGGFLLPAGGCSSSPGWTAGQTRRRSKGLFNLNLILIIFNGNSAFFSFPSLYVLDLKSAEGHLDSEAVRSAWNRVQLRGLSDAGGGGEFWEIRQVDDDGVVMSAEGGGAVRKFLKNPLN